MGRICSRGVPLPRVSISLPGSREPPAAQSPVTLAEPPSVCRVLPPIRHPVNTLPQNTLSDRLTDNNAKAALQSTVIGIARLSLNTMTVSSTPRFNKNIAPRKSVVDSVVFKLFQHWCTISLSVLASRFSHIYSAQILFNFILKLQQMEQHWLHRL